MARAPFNAPTTSWKPLLEKRAEEAAKNDTSTSVLSEESALKTALDVFKYNASSRAIEQGPYAAQSPKSTRCIAPTNNGPCNLATKLKAPRCAIHTDFGQFAALGIDPQDFFEGSLVEAALQARYDALKPKV